MSVKEMRAHQLHVIEGTTPGEDGRPIDPFARFSSRIMQGGTLDDDLSGAEVIYLRPTLLSRLRKAWRVFWYE